MNKSNSRTIKGFKITVDKKDADDKTIEIMLDAIEWFIGYYDPPEEEGPWRDEWHER